MPFLIVERGNEKGRRLDLTPGRSFTFGRDPECDLQTTDHLCAPRHFEIFAKDGACYLRDLGSEHGTYVNEERIPSRLKLRDGDTIHAGETQIGFSTEEGHAARPQTTRVIGGYRILERIGRGGMGAVYKANQVSLNRVVALKLLSHRISADPAFVKRFQSEAQAAGRLNHPNIVQVYDVGFDQGVHYYSMEYIENGSVQDLATRMGALDFDLALGIATDAARGLVYAEKRGLVHRDIKPDNLMINSEGVVKIADLGLAQDAGERARHAGEGSKDEEDVFGTPQFISPEQAQGLPVDTRSDIYSLGASLYRLVTGQPPFTGENVAEIVQKQVHEQPEPVRKLRPDCPPPIAAAIEKAMQKDPAQRFQTAQELLEALEAADDSLKGRKGRGALVAAAIAAVALLGVGAWYLTRSGEAPPAPVTVPESRPETRSNAIAAQTLASIERERDAARAMREAIDFERDAIARGNEDLAAIRARYLDVADRYPDTPDGREAAAQVASLDARIAAIAEREAAERAAAESRARAAEAAAAQATQDASRLAGEDRFSEAVRILKDARAQVEGTEHAAAIDAALAGVLDRAGTRVTELLAASSAAEAAGGDAEGPLAAAVAAFGASPMGVDASVSEHSGKLEDALAQARARREERMRAATAHDAAVVDRARKEVHRSLSSAFDPDAAAAAAEAARASLKLPDSGAALDRERAMIEAIVRVRDKAVASLAESNGRGPRIKLPSAADRKRLLDHTVVKADAQGITVKRGPAESVVPFSSLTAVEAYDCIFADLVEKDPAMRADAIQLLVFLGLPERALQVAESLPEGPEKVELLKQIARERDAWALLSEVRDLAARAASDDAALLLLYRQVDRLIDGFRDTRAYLLNRRAPSPAAKPASRPAGS